MASFRVMTQSHLGLTLEQIEEYRALKKQIILDGNKALSIPEVFGLSHSKRIKVRIGDVVYSNNLLVNGAEQNGIKGRVQINGAVHNGINGGTLDDATKRAEGLDAESIERKTALNFYRVGMGRPLSPKFVRAGMLVRANHDCLAKTGLKPRVLWLLAQLMNQDIIPAVPENGSISALGDSVPMAYIAAALEAQDGIMVQHNGEEKGIKKALEETGLTPVELSDAESLALIESCSLSAGMGACIVYQANQVALLTQVATAMAVEALHGRTESFHPILHQCLPQRGQREIARNIRGILGDSKIAITILDMHIPDEPGRLKQDRYSLRSAPQYLGPVLESLQESVRRIVIELNYSGETYFSDSNCHVTVRGANSQGITLAVALDQARQALQICGKLMFAQFQEIVNAKLNYGLPHNLTATAKHDAGFRALDISMASFMSELDHIANSTQNHILGAESHNQSTNSMAMYAARLTQRALELTQMMAASHILLIAQGVDFRWLSFKVQEKVTLYVAKHPEIQTAVAEHKWWDFVFEPVQTATALATLLEGDKRQFIDEVSSNMRTLYDDVVAGKADISKYMGNGTSKLYRYLREDLRVPFYKGNQPIDTHLNKLLAVIKTGEIENLLLSVFKHVEKSEPNF